MVGLNFWNLKLTSQTCWRLLYTIPLTPHCSTKWLVGWQFLVGLSQEVCGLNFYNFWRIVKKTFVYMSSVKHRHLWHVFHGALLSVCRVMCSWAHMHWCLYKLVLVTIRNSICKEELVQCTNIFMPRKFLSVFHQDMKSVELFPRVLAVWKKQDISSCF